MWRQPGWWRVTGGVCWIKHSWRVCGAGGLSMGGTILNSPLPLLWNHASCQGRLVTPWNSDCWLARKKYFQPAPAGEWCPQSLTAFDLKIIHQSLLEASGASGSRLSSHQQKWRSRNIFARLWVQWEPDRTWATLQNYCCFCCVPPTHAIDSNNRAY